MNYYSKQGFLDLSNHNFAQTELVVLRGEWEFFWEKFVSPFSNETSETYISLPKLWTGFSFNGKKLPSFGYASYRLKIKLPSDKREIWLRSYEQATAYILFANGKKVLYSGTVGSSASESYSHTTSTFGTVQLDSNELDLTLHISNFKHRNGGVWHPIKLGTKEGVIQDINYRKLVDIFQIGALSVLFLYYIGIYLFRHSEKASLLFALLSLFLLIRASVVQEKVLLSIFPSLPYEVYVRLDYISIFLAIPVGYQFIRSLLQLEKFKYFQKVLYLISISFAIFCIIAPIRLMTYSVYVFEILIFITFSLSIYHVYQSKILQLSKKIISTGILIFFASVINDILVTNQIISSSYISGFGLIFMILSLAFSLSQELYKNFTEKEILLKELKESQESINRFIPNEFTNLLGTSNIQNAKLGSFAERELCIMFSDMRGFTSLVEKMTPKECFDFLNDYYSKIAPVIRKHGGFIDKFMGDGIMALFPNSVDAAIQASIDMQKSISQINSERTKNRQPLINVGIGIHSGPMVIGIIGDTTRNEGTVISDAVNLASRVEELTKLFSTKILITSESFLGIDNPFLYNFRFLDVVKVKGKEKEVGVVEILDGFEERVIALYNESKIFFEEGLTRFKQKEYSEAIGYFEQVIKMNPFDRAAYYYYEKCSENINFMNLKYH